MNLSDNQEVSRLDLTNKSQLNSYKKNQYKTKSSTNKIAANQYVSFNTARSEKIKKQYSRVYKQLKQTYGLVKKSTTNLIDIKRLVIKDNVEDSRPLCTFERAPSRRKNTTQPPQQQNQQVNPFSTALEVLSLSPQKKEGFINNNIKFHKKLKPLSNFLMKRLETDYLSIQKIRINSKKIGASRDVNVMIGIRSDSKMSCKKEQRQAPETPEKVITKIRQKYKNTPVVKKNNYNSSLKNKGNNNVVKKEKAFNIPFETYYYRDLVWKVNFSNQLIVETPIEYEHRLRVYIGKGNNSGLVRGLIKRRIWFGVTDRVEDANFVWTQLKILSYFDLQKSKKQQIQKNEDKYLKGGLLTQNEQKIMKTYFTNNTSIQERTDQKLGYRGKYFKNKVKSFIKTGQVKQIRMHNHLINNYVIGNKKALLKAMTIYYKKLDDFVFNYLPYTFHITDGLEDENYFRFLRYYYQRGKQIRSGNEKESEKQENIWILKPGQNSNRGYGIKVCKTLDQIKNIIKQKQKCVDGTYRTYIVQAYLQKPLLYNKRKFDLRHYMMITSVNGIMKGYFYREGYVRTSSSQYTCKVKDGRVHLTNDAVQKQMPDYGKYEKGNKISYDELHIYLNRLYGYKNYNFKDIILPKMKKMTTDVVKACSGSIDPQFRGNNFEIFGLDFMIDADFNLWLIQVNTNPCLQISCPLLSGIVPRMIQNALQITLDAMFPPPVRYTPKGVHYHKKLQDQNRFDLIYDSRIEGIFGEGSGVIDEKLLEDEDETFEDDGQEWTQD